MALNSTNQIYFIYKYTFPNGKIYIGQSHKGARRFGRALSYKHMLVGRAMIKYPNFNKEILEYCSAENADKLEQYYIKLFNSFNIQFGYNLTSGGNTNKKISEATKKKLSAYHKGRKLSKEAVEKISIPVIQIDPKTLNAIKRYTSSAEASRETGIDYSSIQGVCHRDSTSAGGYYWCYEKDYDSDWIPRQKKRNAHIYTDEERKKLSRRYSGMNNPMFGTHRSGGDNPNSKPVLQYNLKGNFIAKYDCAKTASIVLGLKDVYTGICSCCNGRTKMAGGYIWRYENSKIPVAPYYHRTTKGYKHTDEAKAKMRACRLGKIGGPRAKPVLQYDMEGNFVKEYISCHNAEVILGLHIGNVYQACNGEKKSAGGYMWKFKIEGYPKHIDSYKNPGIPVIQLSKEGKFIKEWESAGKAAKVLKISAPSITGCCKKYKKYITAGGFKWKYK